MASLAEIRQQIRELTLQEKQTLVDELVRQVRHELHAGITKTPGICGGEACVENTRIPVWLIESLTRKGASASDILRNYPSLSQNDLIRAREYAMIHPEEINIAIIENEADE